MSTAFISCLNQVISILVLLNSTCFLFIGAGQARSWVEGQREEPSEARNWRWRVGEGGQGSGLKMIKWIIIWNILLYSQLVPRISLLFPNGVPASLACTSTYLRRFHRENDGKLASSWLCWHVSVTLKIVTHVQHVNTLSSFFSLCVDYFVMLVINLFMSFTSVIVFGQNIPNAPFNSTHAILSMVFGFVLILICPVLALFCWFFPLYYAYRYDVPLSSPHSFFMHKFFFIPERTALLHSCGFSSYCQHSVCSGSSLLLV